MCIYWLIKEELIYFFDRNGLAITNTRFKKPKKRRYFWKAPGNWNWHKLDYILVERWFSSSVKACSRYWPWPQPNGCRDLHRNEKNHMVPKEETKMGSGDVTGSWKILGEAECKNKNLELQWNNIKMCVRYCERVSGDVYRSARKPCITHQ